VLGHLTVHAELQRLLHRQLGCARTHTSHQSQPTARQQWPAAELV
jgi:hypothetical protein